MRDDYDTIRSEKPPMSESQWRATCADFRELVGRYNLSLHTLKELYFKVAKAIEIIKGRPSKHWEVIYYMKGFFEYREHMSDSAIVEEFNGLYNDFMNRVEKMKREK